jgi:hypothetical protein
MTFIVGRAGLGETGWSLSKEPLVAGRDTWSPLFSVVAQFDLHIEVF